MALISYFYDIHIRMPEAAKEIPCFEVQYRDAKACVGIASGDILEGKIGDYTRQLVEEWRSAHQHELIDRWNAHLNHDILMPITPLD